MARVVEEERDGVRLTNLDQPLTADGAETKRDLVDYLDAMADRLVPVLAGRALSVIRVRPGQPAFMQKNLPAYAPDSVRTLDVPTQDGRKVVHYPVCDDRETLLWFANQRAVEYHPTLFLGTDFDSPTHLVVDLDPPAGDGAFSQAVAAARLVREVLGEAGMAAVVKTSGAKGVHVVVPLTPGCGGGRRGSGDPGHRRPRGAAGPAADDDGVRRRGARRKVFLDSTRSGGATVVAACSPRARAGVPVSFPVAWDDLDDVTPADFTIRTVPALVGDTDPWSDLMPEPQVLDSGLVEEGHTIPVARVAAMHEGKRRKRAQQAAAEKD